MSAKTPKSKIEPVVLPVGGGKGGIGKSVVAANLGLALARLECSACVVDADLGGSDLHNILGLDNEMPGLGEVLTQKTLSVSQVFHQVLEPRFYVVPGDALVVATANPTFQKKRKTLHAVKKLPADFILMDLGAGASITVMDFFLTSPLSLMVMLPERPALLQGFNFLKNALFRALLRVFRPNAKTAGVLAEFQERSRGPGAMRMEDLIRAMEKALPGSGERARKVVDRWRPKLLLNRVRRMDEFIHARNLQRWAQEDLGLSVEVLGFLPEDDVVPTSAAKAVPALDLDPRAPFCRAVARIAGELALWVGRANEWAAHRDFEDSFERRATEFAPLFPPPGTAFPTREELLGRLRRLEEAAKSQD